MKFSPGLSSILCKPDDQQFDFSDEPIKPPYTISQRIPGVRLAIVIVLTTPEEMLTDSSRTPAGDAGVSGSNTTALTPVMY